VLKESKKLPKEKEAINMNTLKDKTRLSTTLKMVLTSKKMHSIAINVIFMEMLLL
jgi:hypothetical protein